MIKIENVSVVGWEPAIRGARNPMNSWEKSDSLFKDFYNDYDDCYGYHTAMMPHIISFENLIDEAKEAFENDTVYIGPNDLKLLTNLVKAGSDEAKFRRMIVVYVDITAPMYWWKEADTYKVGTVRNSCSTMHKIHAKEFTLDDFSTEHLTDSAKDEMQNVIDMLNESREWYLKYDFMRDIDKKLFDSAIKSKKDLWWQMIQLLPSSYNQRATLMLNYEVLANMYHARNNHKLDEWREFCKWIESLPYAQELIVGKESGLYVMTVGGE